MLVVYKAKWLFVTIFDKMHDTSRDLTKRSKYLANPGKTPESWRSMRSKNFILLKVRPPISFKKYMKDLKSKVFQTSKMSKNLSKLLWESNFHAFFLEISKSGFSRIGQVFRSLCQIPTVYLVPTTAVEPKSKTSFFYSKLWSYLLLY